MKRFLKFLRLVLGDFICDQVFPLLCVIAFFVLCWGVAWLVGTAVVYWLKLEPVKTPTGGDGNYMMGFMVGFGIIFIAFLVTSLVRCFLWLRRQWERSGEH